MQGDWISLSSLGTFGGVVFTVTLVCQFTKGVLDRYLKMPTRLQALVVAWFLLVAYRYVTSNALPLEGLFVDFLNGFLVALSSMGAHSVAKDNLNWK